MIKLNEVIFYLYPNTEWTLVGNTLDGLTFNDSSIKKPTQEKIDETIKQFEKEKQELENKKEVAKAKLVALGLTSEDLESLGLGHSHA